MGLKIWNSEPVFEEVSSGLDAAFQARKRKKEAKPPEPRPKVFTVLWSKQVGKYLLAGIHYPGCTTYGGNKVLVFEASASELWSAKLVDPHFLEGEPLSPIARFPADPKGQNRALLFVRALVESEK